MSVGPAVYQNERFYGIAWRPPALLDRPNWSDEDGQPVALPDPPSEDSGRWKIEITPSTDSEGWLYASAFTRLDCPRPGGRAGRRAGDFVRRRKWVQVQSGGGESAGAGASSEAAREVEKGKAVLESLISPVTRMQGTRVRRQTEMERRKSAVKVFLGMLVSTIKRRQLWAVMPMDPSAWFVLLTKHQAQLAADQSAALAAALNAALSPSKAGPSFRRGDGEGPQSLSRELMCAAVHSRAAYGHAMAAGHMASLLDFALLQTVHQLRFDPVGGASSEANTEAVAALAGIPVEDIKLAEWHNSIMRPCHYLAIDRAHGCLVLSIRGSLETSDILSDLIAKPLEIFGLLDTEGLVHEGMMAAATYVHCNTAGALIELAAAHPGWPLLVTGHSMGGSVATVLALLIRGAPPPGMGPVRCTALGAAPVFSRQLASLCDNFVTTVVLGSDVIPRISYASVEALLVEYASSSPFTSWGRKVKETLFGFKVGWPTLPKPPISLKTPSLPSLSGLRGFVSLAENGQATENAARAAESAAAAIASPSLQGGAGGVELTERQQSQPQAGLGAGFAFPGSVSSSAAQAAAQKLALLHQQSQQESSAAAEDGSGGSEGVKADSASVDDPARELLDDAGQHPEPLFLAGRILWLVPPKSSSQAREGKSADQGVQLGERDVSETAAIARAAAVAASASLGREELAQPTGVGGRASNDQEAATPPEEGSPSKVGRKRPAREVDGPLRPSERHRSTEFPSMAVFEQPSSQPEGQSSPPRASSSRHAASGAQETAKEAEEAGQPGEGGGKERQPFVPVVLDAKREQFERILLTIQMMEDHLPDQYLSTISRL